MTWNNVQDIAKFKQQVAKQVAQQDPVIVRCKKKKKSNRNHDGYNKAYVRTPTEGVKGDTYQPWT